MKNCLICEKPIEPFMSFGKMPIANGFLTKEEFGEEYFFELAIAFCQNCFMVQLTEQPQRDKMFHQNYAFYSSTSSVMAKHFETWASGVTDKYSLSNDSFVVEIGSNDGIMLKHFAQKQIPHLGIEPSSNVANVAMLNGVNTLSTFFDEDLASNLIKTYGKADVILAANVMCHIPYIHSVIAGVKKLLKWDGVFIFQDPYLGDILDKVSYDQIYDEHALYFSVKSLNYLLGQHGLEIIDVEYQEVHGGSMRYTVGYQGVHTVAPSVENQLGLETRNCLDKLETYEVFKWNVERSKRQLVILLEQIKAMGIQVIGYGATSKSTTTINYCGLSTELVKYICDTTPIKQGKFSPGMHIPIRSYPDFSKSYTGHAILFAWNHAPEIMAKESSFKGKWITYIPEVKIV